MTRKYLIYLSLLIMTSCGINETKTPSIIELVDTDYRFSTSDLLNFCQKNDINASSVYQWQNHWVIYDKFNSAKISWKLGKEYPRLKINVYNTPFYNFNREVQTHEKSEKQCTNIIMTANLVNDTTLQNQYMEYHCTQFEKWPEISKGFCNAQFQQLLVFRNGRQLMLVISIPKGKTLDELN